MTLARTRRIADIALLSFGLLIIWEAVSIALGMRVLPAPVQTATRLVALLAKPGFLRDLRATGEAYAIALGLAMGGGVGLGLMFGSSRVLGETFEPWLHVLVAIPKVTLYPIILLLFGLGDAAKIAFGVLHGLPTVAIMTAGGVRSLRPIYGKAARAMRLKRWSYVRRILLPAVMPEIVAALRICFALALLGVLVGEMFASTRGLGHLLMASIGVDDMPTVMAVILLLFLFAGTGSSVLLAVVHRLKG
jgi:NitT/TauT family transport system permease protein